MEQDDDRLVVEPLSPRSSSSPKGNKRRRIALACSACRTRKSRCDGNRPKCSTCEELSFDCVYVPSASSNNVIVGKEYLTALETRLATVEQEVNALKSGDVDVPNHRSIRSNGQTNGRPQRQLRFDDVDDVLHERGRPAMYVHSEDVQEVAGIEALTDGMGAFVFTDDEDCAFFGMSSNIAFTRHISRAVSRVTNAPRRMNESPGTQESLHIEGGIMSVSRPSSPMNAASSRRNGVNGHHINLYTLPPEAETLDLLLQYFSDTGLLFPYIHKETFIETYAEMRQKNQIRRTWLGLLNIVLALATSARRGALSAEQRAEKSDVYYQRALGLCDKQMMRGTSLEVVQFLLVMGQYLQGTQKSVQAWTIHGLAVKAAFQLGLHSSEASKRFSPLEREIRKRTWFGCVVLDRTLSMTFGRPAAIPDDYVKLELPTSIDHIVPPTHPVDPKTQNSVNFFNATIRLYKVMWNVIDLLYGGNIGCDKPANVFDIVARLFQMEHQLTEWERTLPPNLMIRLSTEIPSEGQDPHLIERFRVILTLRYHNLRILIHRVILVRFLDLLGTLNSENQDLAMLQQIGSNSVKICVQSSMEIISIVNLVVHSKGTRRSFLGAWWFSLYYTFNAALVIFGSLLVCQNAGINSPPLLTSFEDSRKSLDEAVTALRLLDTENRMVEKCKDYLQKLGYVLDSIASNTSAWNVYASMQSLGTDQLNSDSNGVFSMAPNQIDTDQSPLGMDLGEFMMEGDMEFLNHLCIPVGNDNRPTTDTMPQYAP